MSDNSEGHQCGPLHGGSWRLATTELHIAPFIALSLSLSLYLSIYLSIYLSTFHHFFIVEIASSKHISLSLAIRHLFVLAVDAPHHTVASIPRRSLIFYLEMSLIRGLVMESLVNLSHLLHLFSSSWPDSSAVASFPPLASCKRHPAPRHCNASPVRTMSLHKRAACRGSLTRPTIFLQCKIYSDVHVGTKCSRARAQHGFN